MDKKNLGLYIHIPFCVKKCLYCDFLSSAANEKIKEDYVKAICNEIREAEGICSQYQVSTVFFGGGTPTCLSASQLERIGNSITSLCGGNSVSEYTMEANPGTITEEHIEAMKKIGVNRVSLGLQSAQNKELVRLGRIHDYETFLKTYQTLRDQGFNNINVDLMADIPGQTKESYRDTLEKIIELSPEHISSYSLIVEPGTPFYEMEQKGQLQRLDEEADRQLYEMTERLLAKTGYDRYEISNYAKGGKCCRHNLVYWQGGEYLGIGLGASSYMKHHRFVNGADMEVYLRENNQWSGRVEWQQFLEKHCQVEKLTKEMEMEEFMFLGLRVMEGVSPKEFSRRFDLTFDSVYGEVIKSLFQKKLLAEDKIHDRIYLTNRGIDLSNMVLAEFLLDTVE